MKHLLLPHGPYLYLPSGAQTRPRPRDLLPGMNTVPGFHDEFLTRHNEQRYLLQLGYADRLLGRLVRRLKQQGIYDDTLIVVTADHGYRVAGRRGDAPQRERLERRGADSDSVLRQAPGPAARDGQRRLRAHPRRRLDDRRRARLRARLPRRRRLGLRRAGATAAPGLADGARLLRGASASPAGAGRRCRRKVVRRRLRDFGSGDLATCSPASAPTATLIGRDDRQPRARGRRRRRPPSIAQDRRCSRTCAARRGWCRRRSPATCAAAGPAPSAISRVAVNGRVEAVGRSFYLAGDATEHFAFNVPEARAARGAQHGRAVRGRRGRASAAARAKLSERPVRPRVRRVSLPFGECARRPSCCSSCWSPRSPRSATRWVTTGPTLRCPRSPRRWWSSCSTSSRPTRCSRPDGEDRRRALSRTSPRWRGPRPGFATARPSTTRPSRRCRRSSTRACRGRAPRPTCAATSRASSTSWTASATT